MKIKRKEKNSGITLVALVVTIIVLLIIAGVSIGLVFNSNGLFIKANDVATNYNQSKKEEEECLSNRMKELDKYNGIYGGETGNLTGTVTQIPSPTVTKQPSTEIQNDTTSRTASDGIWYIPKGFKESEESGATIKEGKVIEDASGNEWVWVPCYVTGGVGQGVSSAIEYKRTDFGKQEGNYSDYSEILDPSDSDSVKKYGGFYIGRYEAGAETVASSADTTRKVLIQKNKYPYNYIALADTKTKSNSFASDNNYDTDKVYTKLVSSYAWDAALNFIQKTYPTYATNSTQGNYNNTNFVSGSNLMNTGLTTPVCNIYDMGGNLFERTSESRSLTNSHCVHRGGHYSNTTSRSPSAHRGSSNGGSSSAYTFRPTLYLK